jgi:hypothetical protein
MARSSGFGSTTCNYSPYSDSLSLRLRLFILTLLHTVTRRTVLQKVRCQACLRIALQLIVSTRFQVLFHSSSEVLFTFPSRYWFTIGRQVVFSLGRWSSLLPTGFHVSRGTLDASRSLYSFTYRAFTFCGPPFQAVRLKQSFVTPYDWSATPIRSLRERSLKLEG